MQQTDSAARAGITVPTEQLVAIRTNIQKLVRHYELLKAEYSRVKSLTETRAEKIDSVSLAQCKFDAATLVSQLTALPSQLTFTAGSSDPQFIEIRGGNGQYIYEGNTGALDVNLNGSIMTVKLKEDTKAGDYQIIVRDWSQGRQSIAVKVQTAP